MSDPKRRFIHTNWTRYNCCDNQRPYEFRVTVELVGVDGSDPKEVSSNAIVDLLESAYTAMADYYANLDADADDED